ncbi:RNA pseudouridylate synthase domain-containing protein 1-like [Anthonomus grandis grandis]|uniref:RNA pseudouridylate synthase domain-containing protein 1-like n=1 Tax=Anthonomus grandis grandis TaxID=2921223 RepID=UPI00216530E5|nr:RNA pseudouridylate synthase domain-containing protein 1-like [Anthonomus grandis grandis]
MILLTPIIITSLPLFIYVLFSKFKKKWDPRQEIVFESENFIIVNKQPDLKINSNKKSEPTVQTLLKQIYPNLANKRLFHEFYFPHRLDYSTSGILCIPKTKHACKKTSEAFSSRSTKKYYIALVRGLVSQIIVDINIPIGEDIKNPDIQKMCTAIEGNGNCKLPRNAQTIITVLEVGFFNDYFATKVLCRPVTGRRHQIRVHCCHLGHTIVGDYTYSNRKDVYPTRMYLHSLRLVLPTDIEYLDISTKDPFENIQEWKILKVIQNLQSGYINLDNYNTG